MRPAHSVITFAGTFRQSTTNTVLERWQYSLRMPGDIDASTVQGSNTLAGIAKDVWDNNMKAKTPDYCSLTDVTIAHLDAAGHYVVTSGGEYDGLGRWTGNLAGTYAATIRRGPQEALCVTLLTGRAGPTGKGRVFVPAPPVDNSGDFRLTLAQVTGVVDAVAGLVNGLNAGLLEAAGLGNVAVVSSKGYSSEVTGLKVGRVVDTMRSRRADLLEDYYTRGLSA